MALFSTLYEKVLVWSKHKYAVYYLGFIAFIEAIIFPIPPDVMLVSMGLVKSERAWFYAGVTACCSILGGILGYYIGVFCIDLVYPYIQGWGYEETYVTVHNWFDTWGGWTIICTSFTPIPFKIVTISAGAAGMTLPSFIISTIIARTARYSLVSGFMFLYGERLSVILREYIDKIGMAVLGVPAVIYIVYELVV